MEFRACRVVVCLSLILPTILPGSEQSPRFYSTRGFALVPPSGWLVATKEQTGHLSDHTRQLFSKLGNPNLDKIAAVAYDPSDDEFIESINVVVSPGSFPIDKEGAERNIAAAIRKLYSEAGANVKSLRATRKTFGSHRGLLVESQMVLGGISVRQWQVMIPGQKQSYIVTCTASEDNFHVFRPQFTSAIESMEIDRGFSGVPGWVTNALIGGAIGALFGFVSWLFKKEPELIEEESDISSDKPAPGESS